MHFGDFLEFLNNFLAIQIMHNIHEANFVPVVKLINISCIQQMSEWCRFYKEIMPCVGKK